jgi:GT2 family glycosyltransferase
MNISNDSQEDLVLVAQGIVYASIPAAKTNTRVEVSVGNVSVPMRPIETNPLSTLSVNRETYWNTSDIAAHAKFSSHASEPGDIGTVWVNHLTDWVLNGTQTLQIMINQRHSPCRLDFDRTLDIPHAVPGMAFETWIAQHRGAGVLHVTFTDRDTGAETHHAVDFSRAHDGGPAEEKYQHVRLPLPAAMKRGSVSLAMEYEGYLAAETDTEPFFFIANTRISLPASADRPLVQPIHIGRSDPGSDSIWMEAPVPVRLTRGDEIKLKIDGTRRHLLTVTPPLVKLEEDYGHTLILSSDMDADVLLCVDGAPVERLWFGANANVVRLPARYLTGATRHLSIKDASGSVTCWESQHLAPAIITPADVMQRETVAPFPSALFAQTPRRFASLRAAVAHADETTDLAQLTHALSVLEGGHDRVKLKPLTFRRPENPDVSIVIPAHNKVEVTYLALCSLLLAHNDASFEVIVVDDASTDETATLEDIVSGITVLHNDTAQRFIRSCNRGAEAAKGDYIVLLNNDVEVTAGWLDELIAAFGRFDNVGLAGSRLLYPDGSLQDAGGIVWGSGNPWNYGNRQNPEDPRFSYARQADYLSGAAMMVPAPLWRELGGLSSYLEPMYFEDTDFAFKVRAAGYSTWFVPASVVYHYEGMTSGTDVTTGFKKYQEVNRPKFKRQWAADFANFGAEGQAPDLEKDRGIKGRVLFIDYTTPRPDQDAGSYAALQEIRLVQSLGYKVSFLPGNMAHLGSYTETLQKMGVEVIYAPFYLTPSEYLSKHAGDFTAFYITRYYVAQAVLEQLRSLAPAARIIFNNADLHFLREIRTARAQGDTALLEQARRTRTEEMDIINKVDVVLSYNDVEHSVIQAYSDGAAKVVKCPWVVDVPDTRPPLEGRSGLSFLGSYRHHPNAEGIIWFTRDILPGVAARLQTPPDLSIYGASMTDEIKALESDHVHPLGFVANLSDVYDRHRVFVAPLRSGAGIKGKVLSALAHGIPCVLTPTAAEGIGLRSGHDCFVAETPEQWADAIARLMEDDDLWTEIADNSQKYMRSAYSFAQGRKHMRAAFEAADLYNSLK